MLNEDIQFTILSHFYQLWLDNPWRKIDKLEEVNSSFEKPIEKTVLEANANFLKEKGWIAPPQTMGYSTNITIDGVLYLESIQYSDDIVIRDNILRRIGEEYEKNPLQYIRVNTIVEELGYSLNEIQRNLQIIDHLGLISFRRVANYGYREIRMNSAGFEYLNQPTLLENESQVMAYAYTKLYMLENSLRGFIERSLRATYGELWTDLCNSNDVIRIATEKKETEKGKLGIIYYTDFPHLRRLIINNWESVFKSVFKKQDTIISRLGELETIRHSIAHTRMLSNDNILELELFCKVILKMIMTQ